MSSQTQPAMPLIGDTLRRLSSREANPELMNIRAPVVVIPPEYISSSGNAEETAVSFELARYDLEESDSPELSRVSSLEGIVTDRYAFAFDIDGVLIRGGKPIPEAVEAMKVLNGQNPYGIKVPYIFLTNGGGKTEQERCIQLSQQLELEVSPGQFICGHTPMREMASKYNTVLVIGGEGEKCRQVAEGYGFKDVVTPGDIVKDNPSTTPFRTLSDEEHANSRLRNYGELKIEAIFVFADSRDWAGDQQIILDLLTSKNGYLGTRSETFDEGPPIFFSHNDIIWSAQHDHARLGMGALRLSLEAMFKAITGKELQATSFGKPQVSTFEFATRLLQQWRKNTHGIDAPPQTVYFVGDTPESDIQGANEFNEKAENEWYSILVRTGVYRPDTTPSITPKAICDDVLAAVNHAMELERSKVLESSKQDVSRLAKETKVESQPNVDAIDWAARKFGEVSVC